MEKKILCLLLLVALCAAASGHFPESFYPKLPGYFGVYKPSCQVGPLRRCCGYPYIPFILALYQRPGEKRFNRFLRLSLKYAWKKRCCRRASYWRRRIFCFYGEKRALVRRYPDYWYRCLPVKKLRWLIRGGQGLEAHLRRRWIKFLKKASPKRIACLKKTCRKMMKRVTSLRRCRHKKRSCWWWDDCKELLKPVPTTAAFAPTTATSAPTTTTSAPTTTTSAPTTTTTSTTTTTTSRTTTTTTTPCIPIPTPSLPSTRLVEVCEPQNGCPRQFRRWSFCTDLQKILILCEETNATCLADDAAPKCAGTNFTRQNTCSEFDDGGEALINCGISPNPLPAQCSFNYSPFFGGIRKICPRVSSYDECYWAIIDEENIKFC